MRPARPAQNGVNSGIALAPERAGACARRAASGKRLASHVTGTTAAAENCRSIWRALHSRAESISVSGARNKPPAESYSRRCTNAAHVQTLGITGDSDEKTARRGGISASPGYYRCSVIMAVLRYGMKNGAEELANGLRDGFPHSRGRAGYIPPEANRARATAALSAGSRYDADSLYDNTCASTLLLRLPRWYSAAGKAESAAARCCANTWERRSQAVSGLPLMQLGIALNTMGDARRAKRPLRWFWNTPRQTNGNG